MPLELTAAVVATDTHVPVITFAYEKRGDPPVDTLVMVVTTDYLDDDGNVVSRRRDGMDVPAELVATIEQLMLNQASASAAKVSA